MGCATGVAVAYAERVLDYEITVAQLDALRREKSDLILLDVREPWEVATASIEGSKDLPMNEIPTRAHAEIDPESHIVVLCHHGARSLSVTTWLRREGFDRAQSVAGGIEQWSREIDPKVPRY